MCRFVMDGLRVCTYTCIFYTARDVYVYSRSRTAAANVYTLYALTPQD